MLTYKFVVRHSLLLSIALCLGCQRPQDITAGAANTEQKRDDASAVATPDRLPSESGKSAGQTKGDTLQNAQGALAKLEDEGEESLIIKVKSTPANFDEIRDRVRAVRRLGELKSVKSIPILIDNLMTIVPVSFDSLMDSDQTYPVTVALVQIGAPATDSTVKRFEETTSEPERLLLLSVLTRINGKRWTLDYLHRLKRGGDGLISGNKLEELGRWVDSLEGNVGK